MIKQSSSGGDGRSERPTLWRNPKKVGKSETKYYGFEWKCVVSETGNNKKRKKKVWMDFRPAQCSSIFRRQAVPPLKAKANSFHLIER